MCCPAATHFRLPEATKSELLLKAQSAIQRARVLPIDDSGTLDCCA
jgi:hypothetical protein